MYLQPHRGLALGLLLAFAHLASAEPARFLRFPDVHGNQIVFSYGGDLWLSSIEGGRADRLTSHPGLELFAKFSPDGSQIAFMGQYGGDEQIYVVSTTGGEPRQLTFYPAKGPLPYRWGYDQQVYGWSPDGSSILFRSLRDGHNIGDTRLYSVPVIGGLPQPLPMPNGGSGDFSPNGDRIAYSPLFRDFRTWKRYQGGWAQDLFIFDLDSNQSKNITNHPRSDRDPMWIDEHIYFSSDRDGYLNLFRYDLAAQSIAQLTRFSGSDLRWPSSGPGGHIVFELDGVLKRFVIATGQVEDIPIVIPSDQTPTRKKRVKLAQYVESVAPSPKGQRALVVARGDIVSVPAEKGVVRRIAITSDAHEREAVWSPDGSLVAFISDAGGEEGLWIGDSNGEAQPLTLSGEGIDGPTRWYAPRFSPDNKRIAISDKDGRLFVVTLANGRAVLVADEPYDRIGGYVWSPNGGYLAFPLASESRFRNIHIYSVDDGQTRRVTSPRYDDGVAAFSPDGELLYFLSNREFQPQLGYYEWDYLSSRGIGVFALALNAQVENPYGPQNDEDAGDESDDESDEENGKDKDYIDIEFDGLADRLIRVPIEADNITSLGVTADALLYTVSQPPFYGREPSPKPVLMRYAIKDRETSEWLKDVDRWALTADNSHVLVQRSEDYFIYETSDEKGKSGKKLPLSSLTAEVDPRSEWAAMFDEVWRRFRDHFYVENMHGYDWQALGDRYRGLLPHLAHRSDLNYLLGELIGELNVSHAYVSGGDLGLPPRTPATLLGATFNLDDASGRYQIDQIYRGENDQPLYRSPLTEYGLDVSAGDYILAINGLSLSAPQNPYQALSQAGPGVLELTIADSASGKGRRNILVEPVSDESNLRYLQWVLGNQERVAKASNGRLGYMHIPDMGDAGIREFIKWFYPQLDKDGLVIDVRGNGGGNVSQMLINRLSRKLLSIDYVRTWDRATTYPFVVFDKPMVTLINETSASDGDIFPAMFRQAGLGPLIGKRSWGGIIGITSRGPLLDGGDVFVPEFGNASADGNWFIEGEGVSPDIEVDNDPLDLIEGRDAQLERGIAEVLQKLPDSSGLPPRPADPIKTP